MPRKTKKEALADRQNEAAPFLFDEDALPHRPDLVRAVVEKRYEATGARLLDDDSKVLQLVDLLLRQPPMGLRKIARAIGCSRDSVRAARTALVDQGKLRPFKERLVALYEDFAEATIAEMVRTAELGCYPINRIAFDHGIIFDKRALALGEPTTISVGATAQLKPEAISVQALNSWAVDLPSESESTGNPPKPQKSEGNQALGGTLGDTAGQSNPSPPAADGQPAPPPAAESPSAG
jgi:hypothetical protein